MSSNSVYKRFLFRIKFKMKSKSISKKRKLMDSDSQISSDFEESKEEKVEISNKIDIVVDEAKKSKLNESNAQVIGVLRNSNTQIGKCELLDCSVVFNVIRSLYVT